MRKLFKFRYPKIVLLVIAIILSYFIFKNNYVTDFVLGLGELRYLGLFIAGMLFAFGFSAPFAVGFFVTYNPINLWFAAVVAGMGVMFANLVIFNIIKISFEDEFKKLEKTKTARLLNKFIGKEFGAHVRRHLMYVFAGIIIASPLPDEFGIIMLASLTKIKQLTLAILTFILGTLGIAFLLSL